jgi:hypothetical protein
MRQDMSRSSTRPANVSTNRAKHRHIGRGKPCRSGACASSLSQEVPPPRVLWPAPDLAHETATNEALEPGAGRPRREADHRGDLALGKAVGSTERVKDGLVGALDHHPRGRPESWRW